MFSRKRFDRKTADACIHVLADEMSRDRERVMLPNANTLQTYFDRLVKDVSHFITEYTVNQHQTA